MATVRKPAQRQAFMDDPNQPFPPQRRGGRRWWIAGLVVIGAGVWLAPILVARSPILAWAVEKLTADVRGTVRIEAASLGWFSPIEMSGVEIRDQQGQPVVQVAKVTGERWLAGLLWDCSRLGRVRIEQPKLSIVLSDDGSNLEDVLRAYLDDKADETEPETLAGILTADVQIEIVGGQMLVHDPRAQQSWLVQDLKVQLAMPKDPSQPTVFQTAGLVADARRPGRFEGSLLLEPSEGKPDALKLTAENLPLALVQPVLGRFVPNTRLAGWLSASIVCQGASLTQLDNVTLQGQARAEDFCLAASSLGNDQIALRQLQTTGQLAWQGSRLQVDRLVVESDFGRASAVGVVDWGGQTNSPLLKKLPEAPFEVHGQLDLARLAAMLPETLHLRKETQVTSGEVQVSLASRPGAEGMAWQGQLAVRNLAADNRGQRLAWPQPVFVNLAARQSATGLVVDSLRCESEFLRVEGSGTTEEFSATANLNLNQLVGQLQGLVDFGNLQLAGDGWVKFHWKQPPGQDFLADGQFQVQNFHLATPGATPWVENRFWASFTATGRTDFSENTRLETAVFEVTAGDDRLSARLVQPIADFNAGGSWPVAVRASGELARLLPRMRPWFSTEGLQLAGRYDLEGQLTRRADSLYVSNGKLSVDQLQLHTTAWHVQDPRVELIVDGGWNQADARLELRSAQATSTAAAVQTQGLVLTWPASGKPELAGAVAYQGHLERLQTWWTDPAQPAAWRLGGQLAGTLQFQPSAAGFAAQVDSSITNLTVADASGQAFQEPQVQLVGRGTYQQQNGVFVVEQVKLTSHTLTVTGGGQYAATGEAGTVQADARAQYDLEKLSALLRSYLGDGIYAAGRGTCPVGYRGPATWSEGQGSAAFGWQWANLYGFEVSPGEIQASLAQGVLQVRPLDLTVSEGRVRVAAELRLAEEPMTLLVAPGRLADQIRINPRMCAHALQYIAPVLAGVATADGRFSIELDACRIPLGDLARGELGGRMIIHSVEVGPGPLVQELAVVLGRPYPAQLNRQSVVPFRLVDGRVYHQNLELVFPDLTIRTYGSVGLDKTLAIMAEMPVPPKWIGNNPLGTALKNQTIRLPIGGTLAKPAIDQATLANLSQQFVRNAAGSVIQEQLNKHQDVIQKGINDVNRELDRLFGVPRDSK